MADTDGDKPKKEKPKKRRPLLVASGVGGGSGGIVYLLLNRYGKEFLGRLLDILEQQGEFALFAIIITVTLMCIALWAMKQVVKAKDYEIERLVEQRNWFQKYVLRNMQSSSPG